MVLGVLSKLVIDTLVIFSPVAFMDTTRNIVHTTSAYMV
jgi:hypothetical protein